MARAIALVAVMVGVAVAIVAVPTGGATPQASAESTHQCGTPGTERFSIGDATMYEGDSGRHRRMNFPVTLTHAASVPVQVTVTLLPGTATLPADISTSNRRPRILHYQVNPSSGLTPTTRLVTVDIVPDLLVEDDETFTIVLSDPTGGYQLGKSVATGTITNDDGVPGDVGVSASSLCEGDATKQNLLQLSVTLRNPAATSGNVLLESTNGLATAGSDFKRLRQNVRVSVGEVQKALSLGTFADVMPEGDEDLTIGFTSVEFTPIATSTLGVILDDDTIVEDTTTTSDPGTTTTTEDPGTTTTTEDPGTTTTTEDPGTTTTTEDPGTTTSTVAG